MGQCLGRLGPCKTNIFPRNWTCAAAPPQACRQEFRRFAQQACGCSTHHARFAALHKVNQRETCFSEAPFVDVVALLIQLPPC